MPSLVKKKTAGRVHEFTLVLNSVPSTAKVEKFYGICQDGTLAVRCGIGLIHFHREAGSLEVALRSALADARAAGILVNRVEIAPDVVALLS